MVRGVRVSWWGGPYRPGGLGRPAGPNGPGEGGGSSNLFCFVLISVESFLFIYFSLLYFSYNLLFSFFVKYILGI